MQKAIFVAALALAAGPVWADESEQRIGFTSDDYISILGGYALPDTARNVKRGGLYLGFIYGNQITEHFGVEGRVQGQVFDTGAHNGTDFYQFGGTVDATWAFNDRHVADLTPYLIGGIGAVRNNIRPRVDSGPSFIAEGGLGLVTRPLFWNMRLRGEARAQYDTFKKGYGDFNVGLGFEIPLGRVHEVIIVHQQPQPVEVREIFRDVEVPRPFVDSDGDGVEDALDTCPDTPKGYKVDAQGCIIPGQSVDQRGVVFDANTARLQPNAKAVLDLLVRVLVGQHSLHVELDGYTSASEKKGKSGDLSLARSEAVRNYLIHQGVRADQLKVTGHGSRNPRVSPERNDIDRELNRRVEIHVLSR
jgi:OOP family OmpA-OmpF porin